MLSRRAFIRLLGSAVALGAVAGAYGVVIEPFFRLRVKHYALSPPGWPAALSLRVAVVADLHACDPWMNGRHIANIIDMTNDVGADVILLLGDYIATHRFQRPLAPAIWTRQLARLKAPLGVFAILGNHDWWNDPQAMARGGGLPAAGLALQDAGVPVFQNHAERLVWNGRPFWLAGLGDQIAFIPQRGWRHHDYGIDDLPGTLQQIADDEPALLMAHEPDIFPKVPARVSLTLCGHTHGGQVNLMGWTPVVPSRYGSRYVYGHRIEDGRHIIVSGGLGCSGLPVRIGAAPEIVVIDLGGAGAT